ncbi:MAG: hypothetical protein AB7G93_03520 [Bdellovibrionales bacterium]
MVGRHLSSLCLGIILSIAASPAWAQEAGESRAEAPPSEHKRFGTFLGIGNPYPSLIGINAAYQPTRDLRVAAGYGEVEVTSSISISSSGVTEKKVKAQSYALGADYLFMDTAIRPLAGARIGYFDVSGDGEIELQGFDKSTFHMYSNLGVDWISQSGVNVGTGFNVALLGASGVSFFANVGYFF